jgi:DNA polymerase I
LSARLVLHVHDEAILEAPPEEESSGAEMVEEAMTCAADLLVPLRMDVACDDTWAAAKG